MSIFVASSCRQLVQLSNTVSMQYAVNDIYLKYVIYCGVPGPPCLKVYTCISHCFMFMYMRVFKDESVYNRLKGLIVWFVRV